MASSAPLVVVNMVNLRGGVLFVARDLRGRSNRRLSIEEDKIAFKEHLPLALKNRIKPRSERTGQKVCMHELMEVLVCLEKFDQNQSMCQAEIRGFNECFSQFRASERRIRSERRTAAMAKKQPHEKGADRSAARKKVGDGETLSGHKLNDYIKQFPGSARNRQHYSGRSNPHKVD